MRIGLYGHAELERLINPKCVAVIGASNRPRSFGNQTIINLKRFEGSVYPINPKGEAIEGLASYTDLRSLPKVPDCAVLAVPRESVLQVAADCGERGVGGLIIYASGFSETHKPEYTALQEKLSLLAQKYRMPIVGPNSVGLVNVASGAGLNFMTEFERLPLNAGRTAVVSQSGALAFSLLQSMHNGFRFSHCLATGNACDVDISDYLSYLAEDEGTTAVACVLEGIGDGKRFIEAGTRLRRAGKALVVYKTGRGAAGGEVALSHTGALAGSSVAFESTLKNIEAVSVDSLQELLSTAGFFAKVRKPARASGVGVLATSGGAAVILADNAEELNVPLPPLQPSTAQRMAQVIPDFGRVGNPTDTTAQVLNIPGAFRTCIEAFLDDESIAALIVPMIYLSQAVTTERVRALGDIAGRYDKPIVLIWMSMWQGGPGSRASEMDDRLVAFYSSDHCFRALRHWIRAATKRDRSASGVALDLPAVRRLLSGVNAPVLTERESKAIIAACGIGVTRETLAIDVQAANAAARSIGYPVAVKIESADIPHKSEAGVIRLNVADDEALTAACGQIMAAARKNAPDAVVNGFLVQQMMPDGLELVVGASRDPQFGPLVTVGFGGIMVELLADAQTRLAPVNHTTAREMLESLRSARLLEGFRGKAGADIDILADIVVRISTLIAQVGDIDQIDVNPLIARSREIVAVDALILKANSCSPDR